MNTVLKLKMADTRVEDIESDSDSSSFDNDDFSDDSDDNHYLKIARDIFGDSDGEDNEVFVGQMPENVNRTLRRATCPAENRMICTYMTNLVKGFQGLTVNIEGNTRPINTVSLIFTDELTDNLVEWTNGNYAQKKQLQPDKHRIKWTDTYPDEIRAFLAVLIIMNVMIIVL